MAQELIASGKGMKELEAQLPAIMQYYAPGDQGIMELRFPALPFELAARLHEGELNAIFEPIMGGRTVQRTGNTIRVPFIVPEPPASEQVLFPPAIAAFGALVASRLSIFAATIVAAGIAAALLALVVWLVIKLVIKLAKEVAKEVAGIFGDLDPLTAALTILFLGTIVYTVKQVGGSSTGKELGRKILVLD